MSLHLEKFPYLDSERLFSEVAQQPWSIFLDSGVISGQPPVTRHADFDVLAIKPSMTLVTAGNTTTIIEGSVADHSCDDPLILLRAKMRDFSANFTSDNGLDSSSSLPFLPGAIGYFSYDLARRFEHLPATAIDDEKLPEMAIGLYDVVVVVDHKHKTTSLISRSQAPDINKIENEWREYISNVLGTTPNEFSSKTDKQLRTEGIQDNMSRNEYQQRFQSVQDYIVAGDCYQVNLAKRFTALVQGDPWLTYKCLRHSSPAPYGAFLNFPFAQVLSNSPESFIQCRAGIVTSSPIKGTKPRDHQDLLNDQKIADQLLHSEKDRAENLMIVDLMRNDLSRCCEYQSVVVPKLFELHSFANVHHLISTVTGVIKKNLHAIDVLKSCFPGGSITGAPKIRAMQIIEELEPHRRGLYCGSIAYLGMDGSLETNIAIRTIVIKDRVARFAAGGGLVFDSDVDEEFQEIIDKARMMYQVIS